ncbi:MAG: type II toxin-antitoxin system VapC family toxin [Candidatus Sumerlaeota bacterium]|nr:type II toxin-antitoxin system VapC family toxin [Candidatus Sumerlaeota bacterium]
MKIIADTNTFLAVALDEPEKSDIIRLTLGLDLVAPEVLPFEIGNALTAMLKKGTLQPAEVELAWDAAQRIAVELLKVDVRSALNIAAAHNIYAYDAYYLECALRLHLPLLTLDGGMKYVARKLGITTPE